MGGSSPKPWLGRPGLSHCVAAKLAGRLSHGGSGELKVHECSEKSGRLEHKGEA